MSVDMNRWAEFDRRYGITAMDDKLSATMKVTNYCNSLLSKEEPSEVDKENIQRAKVALMLIRERSFDNTKSDSKFPVGDMKQDGTLSITRMTNDRMYLLAVNLIKNREYKKAEKCLQDLASKGFPKANNLLGYLYENALTEISDRTLAKKYYEKGGSEGQFLLDNYEIRTGEQKKEAGTMYGDQLEKVMKEGSDFSLLEKLLSMMGQDEEFNLRAKAEFFRNAGDEKQFIYYLSELSARGDDKASLRLADFYVEKNDAQSLLRAEEVVKTLRKRRLSVADFIQGECYISKKSTNYNPDKALKFFKKYLSDNSDDKSDERYIIAAHYSALIIFNNPKADSSALKGALEFAQDVKRKKPADANVAGLINDINDRITRVGDAERKRLIKRAVILAITVIASLFIFIHIKKSIDIHGGASSVVGISSSAGGLNEKILTISVDAANVRSGPGKNYDVVDTVKQGKTFTATGNKDDSSGTVWYEIYLDEARKRTGWVSSKVVSE
ncbi:SH3 domain-containing protein [Oribacterium sp. WCC10]|uniref:SH3 domain-containing protein n=1 Tax=Oribacterium sp. WCC10 TaxID=1855343 RepID=UPI0008E6E086|nr:SH3 domain-containing protein [Oribacterium sp. WCC10]SFG14258.1 SH3 domain-containing protein [Oribacterium sp. WCC10]